jgi:hypothetical protein
MAVGTEKMEIVQLRLSTFEQMEGHRVVYFDESRAPISIGRREIEPTRVASQPPGGARG